MKINEITQTPDEIVIDYIKLHCKKYLDEVGGIVNALQDIPLWRGFQGSTLKREEWARIMPVRQDRRPLGNSREVQLAVDDWFQEQFGIRFRQSSVFCTGNYEDARSYQSDGNNTLIVLPVGDYDYCWSPEVGDLFIGIQQEVRRDRRENLPEVTAALNVVRSGEYRYNTDIIDGIQSQCEIMLHCQSIMVVNPDWIDRNRVRKMK